MVMSAHVLSDCYLISLYNCAICAHFLHAPTEPVTRHKNNTSKFHISQYKHDG